MCLTWSGQVAGMTKCYSLSQTDVIFVATDARILKIYEDSLIAARNVTAKTYPCVFDLTFCFSESSAPWLRPWVHFDDKLLKGNSRIVTRIGNCQDRSVGRIQRSLVLQDSSRLTKFTVQRCYHEITNIFLVWIALSTCFCKHDFNSLGGRAVLSLFLLLDLRTLTRVTQEFCHNSGSRWFSS